MSHLAAIALPVTEYGPDDVWRFDLKRHAIAAGAGDGEDLLLAWMTHAMPAEGIILGYQLAERIMPPLLDASRMGNPDIGRAFLDRLLKLVTVPSVDPAVRHGGAGAPPLDAVAAVRDRRPSNDCRRYRERLGVRPNGPVTTPCRSRGRLWLNQDGAPAPRAHTATAAWLESRRDL